MERKGREEWGEEGREREGREREKGSVPRSFSQILAPAEAKHKNIQKHNKSNKNGHKISL